MTVRITPARPHRLVKAILALEAAPNSQAAETAMRQAINHSVQWLATINDPQQRATQTRIIGRRIVNAYATTRP